MILNVGLIMCPDCGKVLKLIATKGYHSSEFYLYSEVCPCKQRQLEDAMRRRLYKVEKITK